MSWLNSFPVLSGRLVASGEWAFVEGTVKKRHPAVSIPEIRSSGAGPSGPIELKPLDFPIEVRVLKNEMGLQGPGWWSSSADKI